jgi:hypothetical protein
MDNYMIVVSTRSQDSFVEEDISLYKALENFMSSDGYRLSFTLPDGRILYIHRSDELDSENDSSFSHPTFDLYNKYDAKVVIYTNNITTETVPDNVYSLSDYKKTNQKTKD